MEGFYKYNISIDDRKFVAYDALVLGSHSIRRIDMATLRHPYQLKVSIVLGVLLVAAVAVLASPEYGVWNPLSGSGGRAEVRYGRDRSTPPSWQFFQVRNASDSGFSIQVRSECGSKSWTDYFELQPGQSSGDNWHACETQLDITATRVR
jgi:hypothetical protein